MDVLARQSRSGAFLSYDGSVSTQPPADETPSPPVADP